MRGRRKNRGPKCGERKRGERENTTVLHRGRHENYACKHGERERENRETNDIERCIKRRGERKISPECGRREVNIYIVE